MASKLGRCGDTVVTSLSDGRKQSITSTPAGPRVAIHDGGITRPVDPAEVGVGKVVRSDVGGGQSRVTVVARDGAAVDYTGRVGGPAGEVVHRGPESKPR